MTTKNRAEFIVNLVGNVTQKSRQFGASIRRFGTEGSRSMRLFSSAVTGANGILDKFDNRMVGFVTGGGLAMAGKQVADHQQTITELGTTYNLTADQVMKLDAAVTKVAAHRKLSTSDLTTGAEAFLGKTNDFEATLAQLDNIALSINGIKMEASAAGNELGGMFNVGFKSPEKMRKWLDSVVSASKEGTGNIGDQLAALRGLGKDTKWQSQLDQQQMLAMLRIANAEFNDPEQAVSAMQGFYDVINDKEKQKILKRKGRINVKDKNGQLKHPADLAFEISNAAKNKEHNLKDVFDGDTLKLAMVFADPKKRDLVKKLAHPNNIEEGLLEKKATQNVQTFNGALTSLANTGERFAQLKLAKPVQDLADAIHSLTPEELDKYAAAVEKAAYAIGAAVAARYVYRAGKGVYNFAKYIKGGPAGSAGGDTSSGTLSGADVVPVYVTNWQDQHNNNHATGPDDIFKSKKGRLRGAAITSTVALPLLSSEEASKNLNKYFEQMREKYPHAYDKNGQERGSKLFPVSLKEWWYKRNDQIVNEGLKPSPYLTGNWEQKSPPSLAEPANPQPQPQQNPQKSPEGKIVIQVETTGDIKAKTKSVKAENVDLRVNTGYSYGKSY
ncbi:hypothetical protein TI10_04430 [Photorhabdus luminescens subsp. luminescens]|uniref:Phage tail tape measure protein n=1 Tax=Photorhabdus luminescens TaxID=29488 RepID=A0A1G5RK65_PHOLU|nr:hypothetical protein [Photorhabdus luminescens]KMW74988.1 hypothetical protein TI10_04430 [Photorhabdus luminescens subsp. luminescens]SCZ73761.1 hypothetical protein SAMN02982990_04377 [Photorhabdus luminescens]